MMIILATIVCALGCIALLVAELREWSVARAVAKAIASLGFLSVGVLAAGSDPYARWIVIGLALGVIGDIALLGHDKRSFLLGLSAFLVGHIAYIVAIAQLAPLRTWLGAVGVFVAPPIAVGGITLAYLWTRLGRLRVPVIAYVVAIITMVIGAVATRHTPLVIGAVLFFASDLSVARERFVGSTFANKAWGLPCYYAGQLLIAWSLMA